MPNQIEWTMIAQDHGRRLRFVEKADDYVEQLKEGQMTFRNYHQDVIKDVFAEQPDTR
jgi:hypothetical protein